MIINRNRLVRMLSETARLWQESIGMLSDIDSRFGDGDHGVTMGKIAGLFVSACQSWQDETIGSFLTDLSDRIMGVGGGSAGPLYGTLVGGLAGPLKEEKEIDETLLRTMMQSCLDEMYDITKARVGDKTMMDALIPAVQAVCNCPGSVDEILRAASDAATEGAQSTAAFPSRFGRARHYGDQTIGTCDAGALSTALLFRGFNEGFESLET